MVKKLVEDIREALKHDLYYVALCSALTLPDICGKAEYPDAPNGIRYIKWFDTEIGQYEKNPYQSRDEEMPYLSGNVIYSLRCSLLHSGNPNVDNDQLTRKKSLPITHFVLKIESKNDFEIYSDSSEISDFGGSHRRSYTMSIRRICNILCDVAESYYEENKEKFQFDYEIVDWDKVTEHITRLGYDGVISKLAEYNSNREHFSWEQKYE